MQEIISAEEKRKSTRLNKEFNSTIETQCLGQKNVVVKNISEGGAYLEIPFTKIESPLISFLCLRNEKINLDIPPNNGTKSIHGIGIVKWGEEIKSHENNGCKKYGIGIQFLEVSPEIHNFFPTNKTLLSAEPPQKYEQIGLKKVETITHPKICIQTERRKEERIILPNDSMFVGIILHCPKGFQITKPISDISASGLSFKLSEDEGFIPSGTILKDLKIKDLKHERSIKTAVVRYAAPINESGKIQYKIGVEFLIKSFEKSIIRRKLLNNYKLRMPRFNAELFPSLRWEISFNYNNTMFKLSDVLNFSRSGIAFYIGNLPIALFEQQTICNTLISICNEHFYLGRLKVVNTDKINDKTLLRCSLEDGWLNTEKIFMLCKKEKVKEQIKSFIDENSNEKYISTDFKCEINDLRNLLENIKFSLDNEVNKLNNIEITTEDKKYYENTILDAYSEQSFLLIDKSFANIAKIISCLSPKSDDLYKSYFRKYLHELLLLSPFNNRCFSKPLGYAGDYEMMKMIYRSPDEGNTLFAKLMNRYILSKTAPMAVRGRVKYTIEKIKGLISIYFKEKSKINITNIGCGPCQEIQNMLENNINLDKCHFHFVDADEDPLLYSQEMLLNIQRKNNSKSKFTFINKDIEQVIREKEFIADIEKQDIIYSVGLFDYLSASVANKSVKCLYELLNPGGIMIICNLNNNNDTKNFMEYVGDWYIIHRNDNEVLAFANGLTQPKTIVIEHDETKVCTFLVVQKGQVNN